MKKSITDDADIRNEADEKQMNRVAIVEARMNSSRLPGKVLKPILGKPMLELLVERIKQARRVDQIVVATTDSTSDDPIEALANRLNVGCFRGSEDDVLDRVLQAARRYSADIIIEITGDCPLIEAQKIDQMLISYQHMRYDFMMNRFDGSYPPGLGLRIFRKETLEKVNRLTQDPVDREHVTLYVWEHPELFSIYSFQNNLDQKYWNIRMTVDNEEDFIFIKAIFSALYPRNPKFGLYDIIDLLERKPELMDINRHIQSKPIR
ncbi:MAG: glycosyltransferase family protein [Syntrophaceae bacterium]|nr:glycosyltransferase family protein [Syntrophaceae bacterium]